MFRFLKPKQGVFQKLIKEQASLTLEGLDLLKKYMDAQEHAVADELTMKEKEPFYAPCQAVILMTSQAKRMMRLLPVVSVWHQMVKRKRFA